MQAPSPSVLDRATLSFAVRLDSPGSSSPVGPRAAGWNKKAEPIVQAWCRPRIDLARFHRMVWLRLLDNSEWQNTRLEPSVRAHSTDSASPGPGQWPFLKLSALCLATTSLTTLVPSSPNPRLISSARALNSSLISLLSSGLDAIVHAVSMFSSLPFIIFNVGAGASSKDIGSRAIIRAYLIYRAAN